MKTISQAQSEETQIKRLAAQRQMYAEAKKIQLYHILIAVPVTIVIFIVAIIFPFFQKFAIYWGIILFILDIGILRRFELSLHQRAAKIQELFDCEVLQLPWNEVKCRTYPDPEDIAEYADKHLKIPGHREKLEGWYSPAVDKLPLHLGRIVCQRSNTVWEGRLRRRYAYSIALLMAVLVLTIIIIALAQRLMLEDMILNLIVPLLPAFAWGIPQISRNLSAAKNMDSIKELIDRLWYETFAGKISEEELSKASRELQDEIYDNRRSSPLVFDWLYDKFRTKDDKLMYKGTDELVREALEKIGG